MFQIDKYRTRGFQHPIAIMIQVFQIRGYGCQKSRGFLNASTFSSSPGYVSNVADPVAMLLRMFQFLITLYSKYT